MASRERAASTHKPAAPPLRTRFRSESMSQLQQDQRLEKLQVHRLRSSQMMGRGSDNDGEVRSTPITMEEAAPKWIRDQAVPSGYSQVDGNEVLVQRSPVHRKPGVSYIRHVEMYPNAGQAVAQKVDSETKATSTYDARVVAVCVLAGNEAAAQYVTLDSEMVPAMPTGPAPQFAMAVDAPDVKKEAGLRRRGSISVARTVDRHVLRRRLSVFNDQISVSVDIGNRRTNLLPVPRTESIPCSETPVEAPTLSHAERVDRVRKWAGKMWTGPVPSLNGLADKVILCGDHSVGKTCLVRRLTRGVFHDNYKATIGVDFVLQQYEYLGVPYTLHLWDTAGQEQFRSISRHYYRGAAGVIVAFDLGVPDSLVHAESWLREVIGENEDGCLKKWMVGLKSDLFHVITMDQAVAVANRMGAEYFEVSSKLGTNVEELFNRVACCCFQTSVLSVAQKNPETDIVVTVQSGEKRDTCCNV